MDDSSWISKIVDNKFNMSENIKISKDKLYKLVQSIIDVDEYNLEEHELVSSGFNSLSSKISDACFPYVIKIVKNTVKNIYYVESMVTLNKKEAIEKKYTDQRLLPFNDKIKFIREALDGDVILYGCKLVNVY